MTIFEYFFSLIKISRQYIQLDDVPCSNELERFLSSLKLNMVHKKAV